MSTSLVVRAAFPRRSSSAEAAFEDPRLRSGDLQAGEQPLEDNTLTQA